MKFALHHKSRAKAACELSEAIRPQPLATANELQLLATLAAISNLSSDIPEQRAKLAANILAGTGLLDTVDISQAQVVSSTTTWKQALITHVPDISRFAMPEPFKGEHGHTWALILLPNASCWRVSFAR